MSITNRMEFMASLIKGKVTGQNIPLVAVVNITPRCNLRCNYCYGKYFDNKEKEFTTNELLNLIAELKAMGTKTITLGGGEPLIRKDLDLIVSKIKESNIECGFNTNGILIKEKIDILKKSDSICVSLDGPEKMNDANRGKGSFRKIIEGIDAAQSAGIEVHTTTVITQNNFEAIDWLIDFAKERKIFVEFNFLFNQSKKVGDKNVLDPKEKNLRQAASKIVEYKKSGAPILFSRKVYEYAASWPDYKKRIYFDEKPEFKYIPCYAGKFLMFIDTNGKVYPCVQLIDVFKALDFRKVGIRAAWKNCSNNSCKTCYFPCFNEFNLIMGLDYGVISKQILNSLKKKTS